MKIHVIHVIHAQAKYSKATYTGGKFIANGSKYCRLKL